MLLKLIPPLADMDILAIVYCIFFSFAIVLMGRAALKRDFENALTYFVICAYLLIGIISGAYAEGTAVGGGWGQVVIGVR